MFYQHRIQLVFQIQPLFFQCFVGFIGDRNIIALECFNLRSDVMVLSNQLGKVVIVCLQLMYRVGKLWKLVVKIVVHDVHGVVLMVGMKTVSQSQYVFSVVAYRFTLTKIKPVLLGGHCRGCRIIDRADKVKASEKHMPSSAPCCLADGNSASTMRTEPQA